MKRLLASVGTGIFVNVGIFLTLLFVRALFRVDAPGMFLWWLFGWPVFVVRLVPGISLSSLVWISLALGMLLNIVFVSIAVYILLRAINSRIKRANSVLPPKAPTFP